MDKTKVTVDPEAKTISVESAPGEPPKPSAYQQKLIRQWYEEGHRTQPPFMLGHSGELVWVNRKERKAREAQARRRK